MTKQWMVAVFVVGLLVVLGLFFWRKPAEFSQERWDTLKMTPPSEIKVRLLDPQGQPQDKLNLKAPGHFSLEITGQISPDIRADFASFAALNQLLRVQLNNPGTDQAIWRSTPEKFVVTGDQFECRIPMLLASESRAGTYDLSVSYYFNQIHTQKIEFH